MDPTNEATVQAEASYRQAQRRREAEAARLAMAARHASRRTPQRASRMARHLAGLVVSVSRLPNATNREGGEVAC